MKKYIPLRQLDAPKPHVPIWGYFTLAFLATIYMLIIAFMLEVSQKAGILGWLVTAGVLCWHALIVWAIFDDDF